MPLVKYIIPLQCIKDQLEACAEAPATMLISKAYNWEGSLVIEALADGVKGSPVLVTLPKPPTQTVTVDAGSETMEPSEPGSQPKKGRR